MKPLPIAVIVLVTVNIVLVLVQVFRSWLPWEWEDSTSFALQRKPPARKLKLWPFLQASGYLIATVVTLAVWLGFSSDLALQCLLESCWLNSFFGQWLMLHKIFGDGDRAQLVYIGSGLNVGIDLVGFVLMQVPVANLQGRFLVLLSHAIFYFSSGIAINSIWLVDNLKTLRYAAFISVFAVTACGLVVNGLIFLRKDNSIFLFLILTLMKPVGRLLSPVGRLLSRSRHTQSTTEFSVEAHVLTEPQHAGGTHTSCSSLISTPLTYTTTEVASSSFDSK
ncbi:hypothetical protein T440DRAFT_526499 [Plenodomus tracheiphilus IPT5]|uniref:Uncharacterized protein n=1 Tax=Plenodomus tracheiphilus IPT5 TaxID=1408161 RepID=A0A6A7APH4_9PLEO|nr:hypothetical protein T440DRAFT_526499 [Plenodomus tracheiphilus IPT5]